MVSWDVERSPMSVQLLVRLGADHGVPAPVCLKSTGLTEESLREVAATVSAHQELTVIANLLRTLGDPPGLGLEAGIKYHLTTYGIWGFAMISSPTWRSAIDIGLRYRTAAPPDAEQVAAALHMSERTLRRRLAADGVTFRGLLDEIREQLAEEFLVTGGMSVAEVAQRLGYVEVSSFSQAFRRWKGVGPRDFRARQLARHRAREPREPRGSPAAVT